VSETTEASRLSDSGALTNLPPNSEAAFAPAAADQNAGLALT
jgi:hypothetical protein